MNSFWKQWQPINSPRTEELLTPAIMQSLSNSDDFDKLPDFNPPLSSTNESLTAIIPCAKCNNENKKSFLLLDGQENMQISCIEEFLEKLNCTEENTKVKVVSIFGNTGDGKTHTMNHVFFKGEEVFRVSNNQNCCTLGIWAAFDPILNVICLDTEGLQGIISCDRKRTKLLLKVLAVSDIVIYGMHSERLTRDLFTFLGTASSSFNHYFKPTLQMIGKLNGISSSSAFGPSIVILHETKHTKPLTSESGNADDILKTRFAQMNLEVDAFSSIKYIGLQTENNMNYEQLQSAIETELKNRTVRSARKSCLVYYMLKSLNDHFFNGTENFSNNLFPDQYFSCPVQCLSCGNKCSNSMGHIREGKPHSNKKRCKYQCQYENVMHVCRKCYKDGKEIEVNKQYEDKDQNSWYSFAKSVWSGYVINCSHCGVIYKSRQYWYGNYSEDSVIRKKIIHVWNMPNRAISQNTAQRVLDSVSYITGAVANVSLQPTKALKAWAADQVAPSYWRPNNEIKQCYQCKIPFSLTDDKHHCRECGEGFCNQCSSKTKCVPQKNWYFPVRVCDICYEKETSNSDDSLADDNSIRKVSEHVVSSLNVVGNVLNYSKSFIKDSARPSYWIPDSEIINCKICKRKFSVVLPLHHCRACGHGVCHDCSQHHKPVPHRGWEHPVRVCNECI